MNLIRTVYRLCPICRLLWRASLRIKDTLTKAPKEIRRWSKQMREWSSIFIPPVKAHHAKYSMIFSVEDDCSGPSEYLMDVSINAINEARKISLKDISVRAGYSSRYIDMWPGEHYRLLAGFVIALNPRKVIEIGTGGGLSALAMKKFLDPDAQLFTFDVLEWNASEHTSLRTDDFSDGRLVQIIDDLSDPIVMEKHAKLLEDADIIFVDAAKDGFFEPRLLENLCMIRFKKPPLLIFDDIREVNMLSVWRNICVHKMDLTSFGHWSGTGLVHWSQ